MFVEIFPNKWKLHDYAGGLIDLHLKQLVPLHDQSFVDDPTRVFRSIRFAVRCRFSINNSMFLQCLNIMRTSGAFNALVCFIPSSFFCNNPNQIKLTFKEISSPPAEN
jgi:tRNA nucleotidyltransferase/poly(A) polymerase